MTTVKEAKLVSILVFISHGDGCQDSLRGAANVSATVEVRKERREDEKYLKKPEILLHCRSSLVQSLSF